MMSRLQNIVRRVVPYVFVAAFSASPATTAVGQSGAGGQVLVSVEFLASSSSGPVTDLRPDDIALRVDGLDRQVIALDRARDSNAAGLSVPFATNVAQGRGRDVIFVVDEESYRPGGESRVREAITEALGFLTPRDRAGLVSLHASGPVVAVSAQPAALRAAAAQLRGRAMSPESAVELSCRTRRLLPVLSSLFAGLDAGVTTSVVLFSASLAAPVTGVLSRGAESACMLPPSDFDEFRGAAGRSAARFYAIQLADSTAAGQDVRGGAGLERLAGDAGGEFLRVSGDTAPAMRNIVSGAVSFYVASFLFDRGSQGAGKRPVELRARRDGISVRVRPDITPPPIESKTTSPRDMMRVATGFRALPLRAAAMASRDAARTVKVVVLFEPIEPLVKLSAAMAGLFDADGRLVAESAPSGALLDGRPVVAGMIVPPGAYRLRVAAVDSRGRSGAVDTEVRAELAAAGPVTTSGVVLGVQTQTGFSPRLQFTAADSPAAVYLEVYGVPCSTLSGVFELAATQDGAAIVTATAQASAVEQSDACVLFGELNLARVPAGDSALRIQLLRSREAIGARSAVLRVVR
jgi:hypothetical protein